MRLTRPLTDEERERAGRREHLELCRRRAEKLSSACHAYTADEFYSACAEGLLDAVRRFDPSRGVPFAWYAAGRMDAAAVAMMRRDGGGVVRLTRKQYQAGARVHPVPLDVVAGSLRVEDRRPEDDLEGYLVGLDPFEREIIRLYYGPEALNLAEIGDRYDSSPTRIGRRIDGLLERLRRRARSERYRHHYDHIRPEYLREA